MKISKQTFEIMKNFTTINVGILVENGTTLQTISNQKNILAKAEVPEHFDTRFALYDLVQFLNLANSPVLVGGEYNFEDEHVKIIKDGARSTYYYSDESTINIPTKEVNMPEPEIKFELTEADLSTIRQMAGILGKSDISVRGIGDEKCISVLDVKDPTSNTFDLEVSSISNGEDYDMHFKVDNIKILKGNYDVGISSQGIGHFVHQDLDLQYWIALEPTSNYGRGDG